MFLVVSFEMAVIDAIALTYCELPPTETTSGDQLKPKNSIDNVTSISWLPNMLKGGKSKVAIHLHAPPPLAPRN